MLNVYLKFDNVYQGFFDAALEHRLPQYPKPRGQELNREKGSTFFLRNLFNKANLQNPTTT
jgi:hypothetical protein